MFPRTTTKQGCAYLVYFLLLVGLAACSSEITDEDLQLWTQNDRGLEKMREVMADSSVPQETRVKGMLAMVDAQKGHNLRELLSSAAERDEIIAQLKPQLLERMKAGGPTAIHAKSGLLNIVPYLNEQEEIDDLKKSLAAWAFEGLDKDSPTKKIREQIENRISIGEITRLGKFGTRGASLLISRGFEVGRLFDFMRTFQDDAINLELLEALKQYETNVALISWKEQIERIYSLKSVDAFKHLLEIRNTRSQEDQDIGDIAWETAGWLLDEEEIRKESDQIIPLLLPLMETDSPDDRWMIANWILLRSQTKHLDTVLAAFKDDKIYTNGSIDPHKNLLDFCNLAIRPIKDEALKPLHTLVKSGNRVQKSIGLTCFKLFEEHSLDKKSLTRLKKSNTDISDFLGDDMKIGTLTINTIDSIDLILKWKAAVEAKSMTQEEFESRRYYARTIINKTGEELATFIDQFIANNAEEEDKAGSPSEEGDSPS